MKQLQPIGKPRKKDPAKREEEQISFRLSGDQAKIKKEFATLLTARGLDMKEVLVEFISYYVKYRGNIGVGRLDAPSEIQTEAELEKNRSVIDLTGAIVDDISIQFSSEHWHELLEVILKNGSSLVRGAITSNLESFALLVRLEVTQNIESNATHASNPEIDETHQRAQNALRRSRRNRESARGVDPDDRAKAV